MNFILKDVIKQINYFINYYFLFILLKTAILSQIIFFNKRKYIIFVDSSKKIVKYLGLTN